ncbi:SDH family Clp fold serine proteinase [Hymenobacter nivis]|uniref:Serine dehydrogenasease n=1 Tax=Hymenobacter nivis TaxID=1850093 RepID=A0A2Z3GLN4_9BACT|nr:ATP-dependent Clp protease proteolytic subunit [Hymenobacter nivis]AWM34148.1 serine dehydrogenasease [Hymenobacter nivis]
MSLPRELFDKTIFDLVTNQLKDLEAKLDSDVLFYYGPIDISYIKLFRDCIEELKSPANQEKMHERLTIVLNTPGGSAEATEKMVEIVRANYSELYFVVPDFAMSAGTLFCMAGDKIYMDYSSSLGPIDPQVLVGNAYVPALGYLDKVDEFIKKSAAGTLTQAEFLMLQQQDIAKLNFYQQAKELTISLMKDWLVQYKFKDWTTHRTDAQKKGQPVTNQEKIDRADSIARDLGDNKRWHSHGRFIGINTIQTVLRLEVEDYSKDVPLRNLIRSYNDMILSYILRHQFPALIHSKLGF